MCMLCGLCFLGDNEFVCHRLVTYGLAELQMEGDGNCQVQYIIDFFFVNLCTTLSLDSFLFASMYLIKYLIKLLDSFEL